MINPTSGDAWYSSAWSNGESRSFLKNNLDPFDNRFGVDHGGSDMEIDGKGVAILHDKTRLFVQGSWLNTDMQAYFYVPTGVGGVISLRGRSNHKGAFFHQNCGFGDYLTRWDLDGKNEVRTGKEPVHPIYTGYSGIKGLVFPKDRWVELRLVIRNIENDTKVAVDAFTNGEWVSGGIDNNDWPGAPTQGSELWNKAKDCVGKGDKILENISKAFFGRGVHCWLRCDVDGPIKISNFSVREIAPG
jgi:hypothetical protein